MQNVVHFRQITKEAGAMDQAEDETDGEEKDEAGPSAAKKMKKE